VIEEPSEPVVSCRHCRVEAADPRFVCDECQGAWLCAGCAKEVGLMGVDVLVREQRAAAKQARAAAAEKKSEDRTALRLVRR
jgi:hypothetical protein